jgi:hypothetical protein
MDEKVSLDEANIAQEYYRKYFLKRNEVDYVAVVKHTDPNKQYAIEIGKKNGTARRVNVRGKKRKLKGFFNNNYIPHRLPIPNSFENSASRRKKFRNDFYSDKFIDVREEAPGNFVTHNVVSKYQSTKIEKNQEATTKNDLPKIKAGNSISRHLLRAGTLGGIFELEDFPKMYFGISNWHVLSDEFGHDEERNVISPGGDFTSRNVNTEKKIGTLFWKSIHDYREAAFVKIDEIHHNRLSDTNDCGYSLSGEIDTAKIGDLVKKCGNATGCNGVNGFSKNFMVYSVNASVKVNGSSFSERVFHNQILVPLFSENGDSGSIVVNEKYNVIGLLFARSDGGRGYSVVNDINYIFNREFNEKQTIYIDDECKEVSEFKLKKFI